MKFREWSKLSYRDPEPILIGFREIERTQPLHELPYEVASLRTREMRKYGEWRQCAIFCYLFGQAMGYKDHLSEVEKSDYDCVARCVKDGLVGFVPVQMKELVPEKVNATASLQELINSLAKYTDSNDLVVAVHLNRTGTVNLSELVYPQLNIGALWLFGANGPDQAVWTLIGNLLKPNWVPYEIRYAGA